MNLQNDTICAISTAISPAGVGIIRVSGDDSIKIISSIFVNKDKKNIKLTESHKVLYGFIYDKTKDFLLDEVLVIPMFAPRSYTKENVVEIQCHGGVLILKSIMNLLVKNGCRIADPGEFTKRAFLNGRIDLSKAEAVSDLIVSKNEYARLASFNQLKGNLSEKIEKFRKDLLESIAFIEACLDDPEHMSVDSFKPKLKEQVKEEISELENIIKNYNNGRIIKEGIKTVILGKPNVGKSSLLNTLLNEERAIVTDIAGTTRDTIKETITIKGISLNIIDTAGIRNFESLDTVEKIGIEKAKEEAKNADLIILLFDASKDLDKDDAELINLCKSLNKKTIILNNKCDIANINHQNDAISFSTKTKEGLEKLIDKIESMFINKELDFNNEIFISNERQLFSIIKAKDSLSNVLSSIEKNMPEDLLTIDLTDAYTYLSQVLGIEINDDIINEIFSKFCMGK